MFVVLASLLPDSPTYQAVLLVHILAAIVGFGSTFVWPLMAVKTKDQPAATRLAVAEVIHAGGLYLTTIPIALVGVSGLALGVMADSEIWLSLADPWLSASMTLYLLAWGVSLGLLAPANVKALECRRSIVAGSAGPDTEAELEDLEKKVAMFGGILHLSFLVVLALMVFKPGSSGAI